MLNFGRPIVKCTPKSLNLSLNLCSGYVFKNSFGTGLTVSEARELRDQWQTKVENPAAVDDGRGPRGGPLIAGSGTKEMPCRWCRQG